MNIAFFKIIRQVVVVILIMMPIASSAQEWIEGLMYLSGKPVSIEIKDGKIVSVKQLNRLADESGSVYVAPGLIDNQVNGYGGVSFMFGGGELTKENIQKATRELWRKGVTTYLPTLTSNSHEMLVKNLAILSSSKNDDSLHGSIPGYHLEGPYISPEDGYRGAQPLEFIHKPEWNEFLEFYEVSGKNILTVTIAPELNGAMEFIQKCTELGIVVALGHHNASKVIVDAAVLNGAKTCTHLGNGCANMINRHNNPLWPQLANDGLMASIICDGFHLRDEEIVTFFKTKGPEKTIITSDVTRFAGLPPGQYFNKDGETIELTKEGMLRYPAQDMLYGSAISINRGVVKIMEVTGCSLGEAIRMASTNPAKLYMLNDRGSIEPGKRADLILFTIGEKELDIKKTYVAGELVYEALK